MTSIRRVPSGQLVHLTDQTTRGERHFVRAGVAAVWLDCLTRACDETDLEVLHFCVMSNHTHLVARSPGGQLASAMWQLKSRFAHYLRRRDGVEGTVFARRYSDTLVLDEQHFVNALRYVSRNPIDAGMVRAASAHRWSAHRALVGDATPPRCLALETLHGMVGGAGALRDLLADLSAGALPARPTRGPRPSIAAQEVLRLVHDRGLTQREAAEALGVSQASVHRALARDSD